MFVELIEGGGDVFDVSKAPPLIHPVRRLENREPAVVRRRPQCYFPFNRIVIY